MTPWQLVKTKLQSDVDRLRDDLEHAIDWDEYNRIKGRLEQARDLLQFVEDSMQ